MDTNLEVNGKQLDLNSPQDRLMFFNELSQLLTPAERNELREYQAAEDARKRELYG